MAQNFNKSVNLGLLNGSGIVSNLEAGGQLGLGAKPGALDAATPLVMVPALIYVTQTPHMWDLTDDGIVLARVVKSMFETHAKSVSGIDIGYTLESGQQPVGHDGQQMDAPTVSKRNAVQPNFTFGEVTGNLVFRCIQTWIWDIADPDTQISLARLPEAALIPFTMSAYALSFMALQPDPTMASERLLAAIYITNVYPTGTNEMGIKREIGQASTQDRSISFTGLAIENSYIYALGKEVMRYLALRSGAHSAVSDPYSHGNPVFQINTGDAGLEMETGAMDDQFDKFGDEFQGKQPEGAGTGDEV